MIVWEKGRWFILGTVGVFFGEFDPVGRAVLVFETGVAEGVSTGEDNLRVAVVPRAFLADAAWCAG